MKRPDRSRWNSSFGAQAVSASTNASSTSSRPTLCPSLPSSRATVRQSPRVYSSTFLSTANHSATPAAVCLLCSSDVPFSARKHTSGCPSTRTSGSPSPRSRFSASRQSGAPTSTRRIVPHLPPTSTPSAIPESRQSPTRRLLTRSQSWRSVAEHYGLSNPMRDTSRSTVPSNHIHHWNASLGDSSHEGRAQYRWPQVKRGHPSRANVLANWPSRFCNGDRSVQLLQTPT